MLQSVFSAVINYALPHRCSTCFSLGESSGGMCSSCFLKLDFIADPLCDICGFPFEFKIDGLVLCASCIAKKPKYNLSRSLFKFNASSKGVIHDFKFNDKTHYAKLFAKLIVSRYSKELNDIDIIVPIPMNRYKRLLRMYNPPEILAIEISKLLSKKIYKDLIIKTKWTKPQTALSKVDRQKNLDDSLVINSKYNFIGKNILLVDDVKTTGATGNKCSLLLKKSGAKSVKFFTIGLV